MKAIAAISLAIYISSATAQTLGFDPVRSRGETYVIEGLGGLAGLTCGSLVGAALVFGLYRATDAGMCAVLVGYAYSLTLPAWTELGASRVSDLANQPGSRTGAAIGAYIGALAGVGMVWLGYRISDGPGWGMRHESAIKPSAFALGTLLIPTGAVVGYNWHYGRSPTEYGTRIESRIGMPAVALERVLRDDATSELGIRVQVASLQF